MAQAAHVPTEDSRRQVSLCKIAGMNHATIGKVIGISDKTLEKYYPDELEYGQSEIDAKIVGQIVRQCLDGNTTMLIFYAKTRLGWKETARHEHSGPDGGAIKVEHLAKLTDDQLAALALLDAPAE